MTAATAGPLVEPPAEPVLLAECPHCAGTGLVDDDWHVDDQLVAASFRDDRCDGEGTGPVDADGRCACDECVRLPADQRAGSDQADPDLSDGTCPRCEGNGTSQEGDGACAFCGGSGWDAR